jgi:hypothetical protein
MTASMTLTLFLEFCGLTIAIALLSVAIVAGLVWVAGRGNG